ncbi:MAG: diguanylate cyclase [Gemmataceae bacterium]|nr:diguanylate cyclase [Gemmataceae bacterium]
MQVRHRFRFDELKATGQLPTPTGVALAIMRLAASEHTTVAELARVLAADPAVVGRVLKVANSALSGSTRPITGVREAIVRLGVCAVRNIALGFAVVGKSGRAVCRAFDYHGFWARSLATGLAAQAVGQHLRLDAAGDAFTAGLLCQVGRLALASVYPEEYGALLQRSPGHTAAELRELERQTFATDHVELTAVMLEDWRLPAAVCRAIQHQYDPDAEELAGAPEVRTLAGLLAAGGRLAEVCAGGDERGALVVALLARGEQLGVGPEDLAHLGDRVAAQWQEWGKLLQVTTRPVPPFAALVERAREATLRAAAAPVAAALLPPVAAPENAARPHAGDPASPSADLLTLVVSPSADHMRFLTDILRAGGHQVMRAEGAGEAMRAVLEASPHLLLLDERLADGTGLDLCRALRRSDVGKRLYIILLATAEDDARMDEAFAAGADDYVVCPVRPRALLARTQAGRRLVELQQEVDRDKEELRRSTAELAVANRMLQQAALTDPLTGLFNRRYALDRLGQEWVRSSADGAPLACLMIDIDHFKKVNDVHGHDVGDVVLRQTAELMRDTVRNTDVVCRLGGEEFLVICPDSDLAAAQICAERVRTAVAQTVARAAGFQRPVTVSIGTAVRDVRMDKVIDLIKAADEAVYQAKRAGRNRTHPLAIGRVVSTA